MKSWFLPTSMLVLASISLVTIGSVRADLWPRQALFFLIGAGVFFASSRLSFTRWLQWRCPLYLLVLILLMLPLLLGHSSRNTSRWIELGFLRLQPSQLAIPLVGLSTVYLLAQTKISFKRLLLVLASLLPPAGLIFISPDLGTTVVFIGVLVSLFWFAGAPLRHLALLSALALVGVILSWMFILKPYQRERMLSFIAGSQQEEEQHYNAAQALIAVGGGTFSGLGWGKGTQSHLQFLPERQTDFIFSSYAEEYGFVGTASLLLVILTQGGVQFFYARETADKSSALYLILSALTICIQAGVNIGMNIGLLPITGVTLPLVSYGGSSILATGVLLGIAQSILNQQKQVSAKVLR